MPDQEKPSQGVRSSNRLGQELRRWRKRRGWTQHRLGEESGVRQETVSRVENGSPGAELDTVFRLCAGLGIEIKITPKPGR